MSPRRSKRDMKERPRTRSSPVFWGSQQKKDPPTARLLRWLQAHWRGRDWTSWRKFTMNSSRPMTSSKRRPEISETSSRVLTSSIRRIFWSTDDFNSFSRCCRILHCPRMCLGRSAHGWCESSGNKSTDQDSRNREDDIQGNERLLMK